MRIKRQRLHHIHLERTVWNFADDGLCDLYFVTVQLDHGATAILVKNHSSSALRLLCRFRCTSIVQAPQFLRCGDDFSDTPYRLGQWTIMVLFRGIGQTRLIFARHGVM